MNEGRTYPNLKRIQAVSLKIAIDVAKYAFENNHCHVYPVPESISEFIESKVYKTDYEDSVRTNWSWPKL